MRTIPEAMALIASLHQARQLDEAERLCWQIIEACPGHAGAWNYLGVLALQTGRATAAVEYLSRALAIEPRSADALNNLANVLRQQGQLDQAVARYEQALEARPDFAEAHYNLGLALHDQGRLLEATAHYRGAIEKAPHMTQAYASLGRALGSLRQLDEAIDCYRRLIELTPDQDHAHVALGQALFEAGNKQEAVACFRRAIVLNPNCYEAYNSLGIAFNDSGIMGDAIECFRRAVVLNPEAAPALNNLALALQREGRFEEAIQFHRQAIALDPNRAELHNNLGLAFKALRKLPESIACYRRALELRPDYAEALSNLGTSLKDQWHLDNAIDCYVQALKVQPVRAELHNNLGLALQEQRRLHEAAACYQRAIELEPDHAEAHFAQAALALLQGDFESGWEKYEWRWRRTGAQRRSFAQPEWQGGPLDRKTILLHAEQGLGDTLKFVRFVPAISQRGAAVILECQEPLLPLLRSLPVQRIVKRGDELPEFDVHAPLLSLPRHLQVTLERITASVPYIKVAANEVQRAKEQLQSLAGFKIGIAWQGNPSFSGDLRRSIPLRHFANLAHVPGIILVSLQKGAGVEQLDTFGRNADVIQLQGEWAEPVRTFEQTAAMIMSLDLVITSDTSIAHLAGALGAPVWVVLSYMADWRWLLDRPDSPWYPTMRLFRQPTPGDWDGAFRHVAEALREKLQAKG